MVSVNHKLNLGRQHRMLFGALDNWIRSYNVRGSLLNFSYWVLSYGNLNNSAQVLRRFALSFLKGRIVLGILILEESIWC